jgi:hypothetical protein
MAPMIAYPIMEFLCLVLVISPFLHTVALSMKKNGPGTKLQPIPSLDASQFQHSLDKELTSLVRRIPFFDLAEQGFRGVFPLVEQTVRLDLLSSAVKVSSQQLPHLYELLVEACDILDLPTSSVPELYVQSSSQANAYTLALQSKDNTTPSVIVVTSALVDNCSLEEFQAILGHELGHIKCEHSLYLTLGGIASGQLRQIPFVGSRFDLQDWRLAAELSCDRASLLVAQDLETCASALLKLFAGTSRYALDTKAFLQQARDYERELETANPFVRMSIEQQRRTHPLPVRRLAELEKWAVSDEYKKLVPGSSTPSQ